MFEKVRPFLELAAADELSLGAQSTFTCSYHSTGKPTFLSLLVRNANRLRCLYSMGEWTVFLGGSALTEHDPSASVFSQAILDRLTPPRS